MKKVSVDQFSIDASTKAPKTLTEYNGNRLYEALQSGMNEIGQYCTQVLAGSDSHEQLKPAFSAMQQMLKEHGKQGPRVVFTFLVERFESLQQKSQEVLDQIAAELNASLLPLPNAMDMALPALTDDDKSNDGMVEIPENGLDPATQIALHNDVDCLLKRIQVVSSHDINDKINALWEQIEAASPDGSGAFSFDIEWDTVQSDGSKKWHPYCKLDNGLMIKYVHCS